MPNRLYDRLNKAIYKQLVIFKAIFRLTKTIITTPHCLLPARVEWLGVGVFRCDRRAASPFGNNKGDVSSEKILGRHSGRKVKISRPMSRQMRNKDCDVNSSAPVSRLGYFASNSLMEDVLHDGCGVRSADIKRGLFTDSVIHNFVV